MASSKISAESTNLDKVKIAFDILVLLGKVTVSCPGVVGNKVTRLQREVFKKKGVAGGNLCQCIFAATIEPNRFFGTTIDTVDQVKRTQPKVIIGTCLDKKFFNRTRRSITSRVEEHDRGRLVGQHVNGELRRGRHHLTLRTFQVDPIETVFFNYKPTGQGTIRFDNEVGLVFFIQNHLSTRGGQRWKSAESNLCPTQHGDIATLFDQSRLKSRIGWKDILVLETFDVRQVHNLQGKSLRFHADRFHKVVGTLLHIKQKHFKQAWVFKGNERQSFERDTFV